MWKNENTRICIVKGTILFWSTIFKKGFSIYLFVLLGHTSSVISRSAYYLLNSRFLVWQNIFFVRTCFHVVLLHEFRSFFFRTSFNPSLCASRVYLFTGSKTFKVKDQETFRNQGQTKSTLIKLNLNVANLYLTKTDTDSKNI